MDDTSNNVIDVPQSKIEKAKALVKKYETPLAVTAAAAVAFTVGRKTGLLELNKVQLTADRLAGQLRSELSEAKLDAMAFDEFLEAKKLHKQYQTFLANAGELAA